MIFGYMKTCVVVSSQELRLSMIPDLFSVRSVHVIHNTSIYLLHLRLVCARGDGQGCMLKLEQAESVNILFHKRLSSEEVKRKIMLFFFYVTSHSIKYAG